MVLKHKLKELTSLHKKKGRNESGLFMAEGDKMVKEILSEKFFVVKELYAEVSWLSKIDKNNLERVGKIFEASEKELRQIGTFKTSNRALAIVEIPYYTIDYEKIANSLSLGLDNIQDPGNLGTIIRTAEWFGIEDIFCTKDSVDVFNPKVIQSTMGALARVRVHYVDMVKFIKDLKKENSTFKTYGTFINGKNIYNEKLSDVGLVIFGNESKGISLEVKDVVGSKLFIPDYPVGNKCSSLNVASSVAIACSEFRRR